MLFAILFVFVVGCAGLNPFTIERVDGSAHAIVYGEYTGDHSGEVIAEFIAEHPDVTRLIFIDLPGSTDDDSLARYGRLIRAAGLETYLPANGEAYSGGVDLFLAGATRIVERGGVLGVHSWSEGRTAGSNLPVDDSAHETYINYAEAMLGEGQGRDFYFYTLSAGVDICKMTEAQMKQYGVITEPVRPTPADVAPVDISEPFCS